VNEESEAARLEREAHIGSCRLCQELAALVAAREAQVSDVMPNRGQLPFKFEAGPRVP
jgi:hypothetical protein